MTRTVGVVGGGILGTVLALRLAQAGARVTVLERSAELGGLAGAMDFDGHRVDRFYHAITPADDHLIGLADELGLGGELRFSPVGTGFFSGGELHPFNGVSDFARLRALRPVARARLAWFLAMCQLRTSYSGLEDIPLERWLRRHCGAEATERMWMPLLDSRFDGHHAELPATYLWARVRRMAGTRPRRTGSEEMGHLIGGHQRLVEAAQTRAREHGVEFELGAPVGGLVHESGAVRGVRVGEEERAFDLTIATLQPPGLRRLLPEALHRLLDPYPARYLGMVCAVLKVRRELLPWYVVNICDPTPITTVVEASHVVGTAHTDGLRLVYLPKYCAPDGPEQAEDDEAILRRFEGMLARIAPAFRPDDVVARTVQRAHHVEPVHALGARPRVAPVWPEVKGLGLASASQVYPRLLNGDSIVEFAQRVAGEAAARLGLPAEPQPREVVRDLAVERAGQ